MYNHTLFLAWNEIETNQAVADAQALPSTRANLAQLALANRMAQGAADAMREHVWQLCAEGMSRPRRRAR